MSDPKPDSTSLRVPTWVPYAVAVVLVVLIIYEARQFVVLKAQLEAATMDAARLRQSNALIGMRLVTLEARDPSYASAKIVIAWDPYRRQGVISAQNLPALPPGRDYQLWVLDPAAEAPLGAGLITGPASSRVFGAGPVSTTAPGFAITLEPGGGSPAPTTPILFAVAPME